jgi:hypothetical protein
VIIDQLRASVLRSSFSKCVSNVVWETLSRARYVPLMRSWLGREVESEDDVFFMPPESPQREDPNCNVISDTQVHLEVNGVVHVYVVKQLIDFEIVHSLRSLAPELSKSKQSWKFVKVIKIGGRKSPLVPSRFDHSRGENHKLSHIMEIM